MSNLSIDSPRRRRFLAGVGAGLAVYGTAIGTTAADSHESVQVVLDNVGSSAWELVDADEDVGEQGVNNPELTLQEETRYTVVNQGSGPHPLAFRDEDGNDLLSQDSAGSYEDQDDVNYEENGEEMVFTLTEQLADDLDTYICTRHVSMEGAIRTVEDVDATVTFPDQATASSTFTAEEATDPAVSVTVATDTDSAVVVTYEDDTDLVIAGLDVFDADELDGEEDLVIPVEDDGGFPGEHVAHIIPADDLSGEYNPGDTVSADTAEAVINSDAASVVQANLSFDDQTGGEPVDEGDVMATVDVSVADGGADLPYVIDVHPTDDDGELVGTEFVGATDVLSGENENAEIVAERVPDDGAANELPFAGTDSFVVMIHVVDDESAVGDTASPGSFPVLPNVDAEAGPVPGGVTDLAEVTAEFEEDDTDVDDDVEDTDDDEPAETDDTADETDDDEPAETDDTADETDDDVPGFGPVAGVAGLGGLVAYAYSKLVLNGEPPVPADDGLDEPDE